jgi:hypothetical protein
MINVCSPLCNTTSIPYLKQLRDYNSGDLHIVVLIHERPTFLKISTGIYLAVFCHKDLRMPSANDIGVVEYNIAGVTSAFKFLT